MSDSQTIAARIPPVGEGGVQTGKLGLIAGNGRFPFLLLDAARAHGLSVVVAAIQEETDPEMDARALLAERFLGNLNQHLLTFLQQVGDERLVAIGVGARAKVAARTTTAIAIAKAAPIGAGTLGLTLLIAGGGRRSPHLGPAVGLFFLAGLFFLFFLFLVGLGAVDLFSTLLGCHHFVLIYVGNLGNPTVRIVVVGAESLRPMHPTLG